MSVFGLEVIFRKEKGLDLPKGNYQRKVEVQTLQKILLVLGLIFSVHHSLLGRHNRLSWEHHRKVLFLEREQCQKGAPIAGSSI